MAYPLAPAMDPQHPDELRAGLALLDARPGLLAGLRQAWRGDRPAAYLSKESRDALDDRLARLGVNFPRLAVESLVERMRLAGLELDDRPLWEHFTRAGGRELSALVHTDRLLYGTAYVTVWATETGRPTLTGDSPFDMAHAADPATGEVLWAVRRWRVSPHTIAVAVMTPDAVTEYRADSGGDTIPATAYRRHREQANPLAVVPVVPFVRRSSLSDPVTGSSAVADLLDLTDAHAKVLGDALVASEFYARPRRWATGLEIEEDEDGRPVDPFGKRRFLQSESPDTKFGQLDGARLDGYADMLATISQSVGALSGLPAHFLGLHGDQPASAEGIRAAEAQLVSRAEAEKDRTADEWGRVAVLLDAVARGVPVDPDMLDRAVVTWSPSETSTPAMDADAAVKLRGIGLPLAAILADTLHYPPDRVAELVAAARDEQVLTAAADRIRQQ